MAAAAAAAPGPGNDVKPGQYAFVTYGELAGNGGLLWHARLFLGHVDGVEFGIYTPDYDLYNENLSLHNGDLEGVRFAVRDAEPPPGLLYPVR